MKWDDIHAIAAILCLISIISSNWWEYGMSVGLGIAVIITLIDWTIEDRKKNKRLEYLEKKLKKEKTKNG